MKNVLLGLTLTSAVAIASAHAADIYVPGPGGYKDPPYLPSWAGFYIGANGGFGWESSDANLTGATLPVCIAPCIPGPAIPFSSKFNSGMGFAGGQAGYNFQRSNFVFGLEADIQGSAVQDSITIASNFIDTAKATSELNWFGTLRGRIGYGFNRSLVYVTGGLAFGGVRDTLSASFAGFRPAVFDDTKTGYVLGGGVEYLLSPSWSVKAEYQYIDLGRDTLSISQVNGVATFTDPHTYNTVRAGLNYHFGSIYEPLK
jgi:outer membrane immunogenic protein